MGKKTIFCIYTLALASVCAAVLYFKYFGFLHMRELYQMFLFTPEYFLDTVRVPGGFADYIGRFLTQFSYYPAAGAAIDGLMLALLLFITYRLIGQASLRNALISSLPVACGLLFFSYENSVDGAMVAIIFTSAAALASGKHKAEVQIPIAAALYFLCGPISVIYPVLCLIRNHKYVSPAVSIAVITLMAFLAQYIYIMEWSIFYKGVHYDIFQEKFPIYAWVAAASVPVAVSASKVGSGRNIIQWSVAAACAVLGICVYFPMKKNFNAIEAEIYEFEYLEEREDWDGILAKGKNKDSKGVFGNQTINLALAMKGQLPEKAFGFRQSGTQCLLTKEMDSHIFPLITAEVFYYTSLTNLSQEFWFDLMKAIPDHQNSARAFRRIAETNACNGDAVTAAKYAEALKHTLFYRKWAEEFDPHSIEYARLGKKRKLSEDFFFSLPNIDRIFLNVYKKDSKNFIAANYALVYSLLEKNIDKFLAYISEVSFSQSDGVVPDCYQQAYLLLWDKYDQDFSNTPAAISTENRDLYLRFMKARSEDTPAEKMYRKYGRTYLFYYFYANIVQ